MSILATKVNGQSKVTPSQFMKTLKASKSLFHPKHEPSKETGTKPYQGLMMQLIASGIIGLQVMDTTKLGTKKITNNDLTIILPNADATDGLSFPAFMQKECYARMTSVEREKESQN